MNMDGLYFQQDGVTRNTTRQAIQSLHELFFGRVIFQFDDRNRKHHFDML